MNLSNQKSRFFFAAIIILAGFLVVGHASAQELPGFEPPKISAGTVEDTGRHFSISDSSYLNVTLDSAETINLKMESIPETVTMMMESVSDISSTQIILSGFQLNTAYYLYQDDYHNLTEFIADSNGTYSYIQDLATPHIVFIQPRKSTKFIKDDATGGDCAKTPNPIGTWNAATKTCILTMDLTETIQIDSNNITLDGNGHAITGSKTGNGVYLARRTGVTIKNLNVMRFTYGISLYSSSGNTLTGNTASNNGGDGILLNSSSNNTLTSNIVNSNGGGINIFYSNSNTLASNAMLNNQNNFNLTGASDSDFDNNIDTSNTIDGKPIYYVKNAVNQVYDSSTNAGIFYCIKCDNVIIKDLTFTKNRAGIFLWKTTNSKIENILASNNYIGIYLQSSSNNTLANNTASSNTFYGIVLSSSNNNTLTGNTASNNGYGINISSSNSNILANNTASDNYYYGIYFFFSNSNTLTNNTAQENSYYDIYFYTWLDSDCDNTVTNTTGSGGRPIKYFNSAVSLSNETLSELILCNADGSSINNITIDGSSTKQNNGLLLIFTDSSTIVNVNSSNNGSYGIRLSSSSNNTLTGNTTSDNYDGISLYFSSNNTLTGNTTSDNYDGIYLYSSSNNIITDNTASNNYEGIYLSSSNNNIITGNTTSDNYDGISIIDASNNQIYKNNFISNTDTEQVYVRGGSGNVFNLAFPIGGNYWSNFDEPAEGCNNANSDNFCDAPYTFTGTGGRDNLPWIRKNGWLTPPIDPLILQYEPILYFHPEEDFYPMNVEAFVSNASLWDSKGTDPDQEIKAESAPVSLDDLTPQDQEDTTNWYLQFSQDLQDKTPDPIKAEAEYHALQDSGEAQNTYYARQMEDSYTDEDGIAHNFIVLQYWYFYAFNDFGAKVEGGNNHEGDWESVMVFLDKETEEPQYAAYSAHHNVGEENLLVGSFDSVRRNWNSNEIVKTEGRIVSFVGLGSHASYPNNGKGGIHDIPIFADDVTSYDGINLGIENNPWSEDNIFVFYAGDLPVWLTDYKGKWGVDYPRDLPMVESQSGPQGPFYQNKFNHPIQWAGIDKIKEQQLQTGENVIETDTAILTVVTNEQGQITVDYHNEIPPFSESETHILFPHFWDIASNLTNETFQAEISLIYNPEEMQAIGVTNPAKLTVFVYNETVQIWPEVPSAVDINNNIIKFQTDHFSRYAIGIKKIQFQDITDKIRIIENKKHYDKKTGIQEIDFKIKNNTKEEIKGMLLLSISDLAQGIEFVNPDDLTTLTLISNGLPENLQAVNFTDSYCYCLFTGAESDIPTTVDKRTKNRLLLEKPIKDKRCSEISSIYPELSLFLEDVLPAHKFTEDRILQFKVPTKKDKKFDYEVRVWGEVKK